MTVDARDAWIRSAAHGEDSLDESHAHPRLGKPPVRGVRV